MYRRMFGPPPPSSSTGVQMIPGSTAAVMITTPTRRAATAQFVNLAIGTLAGMLGPRCTLVGQFPFDFQLLHGLRDTSHVSKGKDRDSR